MSKLVRPLAVIGAASALSLAAYQITGGTHGGTMAGPVMAASPGTSLRAYDLARLSNVETTLYHVEESYVDPARIDYETMFVEGLEAVERRVPACMFRREPGGSLLFVDVGDHATVLEVAPVRSRRALQEGLGAVARIISQHLDPADIPALGDGPASLADVEYTLINGMLSTLDPHSILLTPDEREDMDVENEGEFGGLGVRIDEDDQGRLHVFRVEKGSPAERGGMKDGDVITRIDGVSTVNMATSEAVTRLRGPVGAPVELQVERLGEADHLVLTVIRDLIALNEVDGELLEGAIGYVKIPSFHRLVGSEIVEVLARLNRESGGLRGLVLDMRNNPGGFFTQAVEVSDEFLWAGTIVSTVDASNAPRDQKLAHAESQERYPIAVLVNARSASASEIVAGALRNNGRAVIVGERTFGKGSVQNLHDFQDKSRLKLTVSKYLTPNEQSIQSVGIPADIALVPQIVWAADGALPRLVSLHGREHLEREADLDLHLERSEQTVEEPAYEVHYLRDRAQDERVPEVREDWEVEFCRELLLAATSWRRAEILAVAAPVVDRVSRRENARLEEAFGGLGVAWRDGRGPSVPELEVEIDVGPDGRLAGGADERVGVKVTNRGSEPVFRVSGVMESANEVLDREEILIGMLGAGESRTWEIPVRLPWGYPAEQSPVTVRFRDSEAREVLAEQLSIASGGGALPRLAWSWRVDDSEHGDGDGVASVGEKVQLVLEVENRGEGSTREAVARVRNLVGGAVDLQSGNIRPGFMRSADGAACEVKTPGVEAGRWVGEAPAAGEPTDLPPVYAEGCTRTLAPGERWEGAFEFALVDAAADGPPARLELSLEDREAYDFGAIARSGFFEYYNQKEQIAITAGQPASSGAWREPPRIDITHVTWPDDLHGTATLSGAVDDDRGVRHVMVFDGEDKIFYQGAVEGRPVKAVPFTADVGVEPGVNTLTVVAIDDQGFSSVRSAVMARDAQPLQALAAPR